MKNNLHHLFNLRLKNSRANPVNPVKKSEALPDGWLAGDGFVLPFTGLSAFFTHEINPDSTLWGRNPR